MRIGDVGKGANDKLLACQYPKRRTVSWPKATRLTRTKRSRPLSRCSAIIIENPLGKVHRALPKFCYDRDYRPASI